MNPSIGETQNVVQCLYRHTENHPDNICAHVLLNEDGKVYTATYSEIWLKVCGFGRSFKAAGVRPGDVVLIFLNHHPDMAACYFGAMQVGAIPSFMPCPSTKQQLDQYWSSHKTLFRQIQPEIVVTNAEHMLQMKEFGLDDGVLQFVDVDTIEPATEPSKPIVIESDATALLQHSSGTTGLKKGMELSHKAILNQVRSYSRALGISSGDTTVSWLPLYHDMGLITSLIMPLVLGIKTVLMDPIQWSARPDMLFDAIVKYKGRLVWLPNFAFDHLCRTAGRMQPKADLSKVRAFISCSEPCKLETFERFAKTFSPWGVNPSQLQVCYALAENVFAVSQTPLGREPISALPYQSGPVKQNPIASVGRLIHGVEIGVFDSNGRRLQDDQVGEIAIGGDSLFSGYYRKPALTAERMIDGLYYTRDLGFLRNGELYILGRSDDLIIVNGRNHYAHDLEALINNVEDIKAGRSIAFGLFFEAQGSEQVIIVAEQVANSKKPKPVLKQAIKQLIYDEADLMVRSVHIVDPFWLIKTSSGKINRSANKEKYTKEIETRG